LKASQGDKGLTRTHEALKGGHLNLLINGTWVESQSEALLPVMDPGRGEEICKVPLALGEEVDAAVASSQNAFDKWKQVPLAERMQYLFRMKYVFEEHFEELARINTQNHGKTIKESRGDVRRTIENIEAAIAAGYTLLKGEHLDQIAQDIDEGTVKEPLGVFGIICPFNFPLMVPFWYIPYAIVSGCTVVVKPSEITPLPMAHLAALLENEVKLPPGVLNLVHGSKETVESIISHPLVKGVTFVGSTVVGRYVYKLAGEHGKRAVVQAGAKNSIVVMPDADMSFAVESCISSLFGNSGQRCLAGANVVTTEEARKPLVENLVKRARALRLGYGLNEDSDMGPMVSRKAKDRILQYVDKGSSDGASVVLDGREASVKGYENGYYLGPTIFDEVYPDMTIAKEEIFGPLGTVIQTADLEGAIDFINKSTDYGNAASIFTKKGYIAREFRRRVQAGNIGINIGVAAPIAFFPFGGMRDSFFGVLHGQIESIDFFTDRKVIISKWEP
jgi:malonate-semialdehyde dehydrogenase (acetylating) / methylmalonate-semialdehyde dehydrogenase